MKKESFAVIAVILLTTVSCSKGDNLKTGVDNYNAVTSSRLLTKAYGDKTPKLAVYIETNDVDPLPVLQEIADGAWGETVIMDPNVPSGITAGCRPLPAETQGVTITHDDI